jgi:hypothetical protein
MKPTLSAYLAMLVLLLALPLQAFWATESVAQSREPGPIRNGEMAGYLLVPNEKVPESFNAGFSMYVAAWPLLDRYPGSRFQTGLFGTWMFAQNDVEPEIKLYSDIEGGLGWWRDTRFATETPKFIMGGVAPNFTEWANGPGAGKGRDWDQPKGKYGVAQLSPWLLWPPDGVNLKQGTCGELFGYGYLPLPLTDAKLTTDGEPVPTGDQSWTLFLNTANFKGPVAFFTPYFWSRGSVVEPRFSGMLLDSRPSNPNRALQMETQHVPSVQAVDSKGDVYARVAPTFFPSSPEGESLVVHRITSYNKSALWDSVKAWFDGGEEASGQVRTEGEVLHKFRNQGGATWRIYADGTPKEERAPLAWNSFATPGAINDHTFGYRWNPTFVQSADKNGRPLVKLPEWYRLSREGEKSLWVPVNADEVPEETGLAAAKFESPRAGKPEPYVTPENATSSWKTPGPVAGPFEAVLGDGSVVTYYWYRFADQPALLNAGMTSEERETIQSRVEKLHRKWTRDREYLAPPAFGELAEIDPALLVTPPAGMEVGFVPIVTRQSAKE